MYKIIILSLIVYKSYSIYYNRSYIELKNPNKITLDIDSVIEKNKKNFNNVICLPKEIFIIVNKIRLENQNYNIILHGAPGNGKTVISKAIANETKSILYNPALFEILSPYVDSGELNIKKLFKYIREKNHKAILLIKDIDIIASIKDYDFEIEKTKEALINELRDKNSNIRCIFTTNNLNNISKEILNNCIKIHIDYPDEIKRFKLLVYYSRKYLKDINKIFSINFLKFLAQETKGESYRSIKYLVKNALDVAFKRVNFLDLKISKSDYLISLGQVGIRKPTFNIRKEFFRYFIQNKNIVIENLDDLIDTLSNESQGLSYIDIKDSVNFVSNIKEKGLINLKAFYTGLYYNQREKFACNKIRYEIIEFLIIFYNLKLSKKAIKDLAKYAQKLTAREIKNIIIKKVEDITLKESIYINLYQKLKESSNFSNKPNFRARSILIKYFLSKYINNLNPEQIELLIKKTENLSWIELEELIEKSKTNDFIKYKNLKNILYKDYNILLEESIINLLCNLS